MDDAFSIAQDSDLAGFLAGPVAIVVATAGPDLHPHATRAYAAGVDGDGNVRVHVPSLHAAALRTDLAADPRLAVVFSRVHDFKTYQLKGKLVGLGPELPQQSPALVRYCDGFRQALSQVGLSMQCTGGFVFERYTRVTFTPDACFVQTPGPDAGRALGAADD